MRDLQCHKTWYLQPEVTHDGFKTWTGSEEDADVWRFNCSGSGGSDTWVRDYTSHRPIRRAGRALTNGLE